MSDGKILISEWHCDNCGKDFRIHGTDPFQEKDSIYHCIHCGKNGKKVYPYNDFYSERVD